MCIAQSKAKKREKETEWGRRAAEAEDEQSRDQDSSREMIWKEDGQLISGLSFLLPSLPPSLLSLCLSPSDFCLCAVVCL
jgi:hypothetical protein